MSLSVFVPTNTQKARSTAIAGFERSLEQENVSMEYAQASILLDTSGKRLAATMDRFGFSLATNEGKKGKLSRNTATLYHRNVKLWLFDKCPHLRVPTELILLKQEKTLEKHCLKREKGGLIHKAPPCTKEDLQSLIRYVYITARVHANYQDAALACLMWAERITGDVPVHAKRGEDGVQAYVNRMLKRVAEPAGATATLTSHSFRRGRVQYANGVDRLVAQWIFDRGAWDMTKTNKAFAYITNTAREDRKVARVLSGWGADELPVVLDIAKLDHASQERLERLQALLFSSCTGEASHQPFYHLVRTVHQRPACLASSDHQKKSESRHVVAFMNLFLVDGFTLDTNADDYKDQVLGVGRQAEAAVLAFLKPRKSNAKGAGSALRALRPLHKSGALDEYIVGYKRLLAIDLIQDPAPVETEAILATVGHV
ncbi:hypothetical protein PHMEG_00015716 [Phytophthora megakarya]|uniref:Uncharacterized protein n=1 Tax=Phytophthora megakarya TaxID=4795 RepID=A0A225W114_9STRA|nr:hypothetical protein PHMEG_00015716 [Phytophthora megakarya]